MGLPSKLAKVNSSRSAMGVKSLIRLHGILMQPSFDNPEIGDKLTILLFAKFISRRFGNPDTGDMSEISFLAKLMQNNSFNSEIEEMSVILFPESPTIIKPVNVEIDDMSEILFPFRNRHLRFGILGRGARLTMSLSLRSSHMSFSSSEIGDRSVIPFRAR